MGSKAKSKAERKLKKALRKCTNDSTSISEMLPRSQPGAVNDLLARLVAVGLIDVLRAQQLKEIDQAVDKLVSAL